MKHLFALGFGDIEAQTFFVPIEGMKKLFDNKSIEYSHRKVPGFPLEQLFVDDPDGVKVELNFPTKG